MPHNKLSPGQWVSRYSIPNVTGPSLVWDGEIPLDIVHPVDEVRAVRVYGDDRSHPVDWIWREDDEETPALPRSRYPSGWWIVPGMLGGAGLWLLFCWAMG